MLDFAPGTEDRERLARELEQIRGPKHFIPLIIGGRKVGTGDLGDCPVPHEKGRLICRYHKAGVKEAEQAIRCALEARPEWSITPIERRARLLLDAANLLSKKYRIRAVAVTMLVHSKNPHQAEIDVAELIDFWRINASLALELQDERPPISPRGATNRMDLRPLEGFVFAIPPFNFISIAGNLATAPALMGNVIVWKPSSSVVFSNHFIMELLMEAGLPPGVINFLPGDASVIGDAILRDRHLAGVHFTGSTATLRAIFRTVGQHIDRYISYPRIVGESGGKGFVVVHPSANAGAAETALLRGAFEYQGQKCSAASRAYIPESLWPSIRDRLVSDLSTVKMGPVTDFGNFINAVIDGQAFDRIQKYIRLARDSSLAEIVSGGGCDCTKGLYIEPTVIRVKDPHFVTMEEEIFGPVLSVFVYKDSHYKKTLELCNATSPYALTGSVFARDKGAIALAESMLRDAAGNFYVNDKPTGAVVGQQPFGGARASGTNDKAGTKWNLMRWVSPRTIKDTQDPPVDFRYPFMD
jgi:1-pyrroline-5-carboxylate dehydrogenase